MNAIITRNITFRNNLIVENNLNVLETLTINGITQLNDNINIISFIANNTVSIDPCGTLLLLD